MQVYHLGHTRFADQLTGDGAKLHGGRWNKIGTPCIYTSETKALSVLEYAANVRLEELPASLAITVYELPEKGWRIVDEKDLPRNWQSLPAPEGARLFGTELLQDKNILAIRVPSIIIPTEYNFILNPLAKTFASIKIIEILPFALDKRIKK
jgi:RES domain-containing protein